MKLKSGYEVQELSKEEEMMHRKQHLAYTEGMIRLQPGNWFYSKPFLKYADRIYDFKFKPSDVVIMTYPKCGTTWMQEITLKMKHPEYLDNPVKNVSINILCPFMEADPLIMETPNVPDFPPESDIMIYFNKYCPGKNPENGAFIQIAENSPDPRVLKTHLPFTMHSPNMLDTCKVIFVIRNPKDVCVSFYHHSRVIKAHSFLGNFDEFFQLFLDGSVMYGSYWEMLREAWERRNHPNFHLAYFEDMKANPIEEVSRLNKFLKTGLSDEIIERIVEESSFAKMKARATFTGSSETNHPLMEPGKGSFFRKGEAGSWMKEMTEEQDEKMNEWIIEKSEGIGFEIKYK